MKPTKCYRCAKPGFERNQLIYESYGQTVCTECGCTFGKDLNPPAHGPMSARQIANVARDTNAKYKLNDDSFVAALDANATRLEGKS